MTHDRVCKHVLMGHKDCETGIDVGVLGRWHILEAGMGAHASLGFCTR